MAAIASRMVINLIMLNLSFDRASLSAEIGLFVRLANAEHLLEYASMAARYRSDIVAPDDLRPVRIAAVVTALGFDDETVRRKIAILQADGRCLVDNRGVILRLPDDGATAFPGDHGGLPARLATLIGRLRSLILENGYDAAAFAALGAAL